MAIKLVKAGQSVTFDKGLRNLTIGLKWGGSSGGGLLSALFGSGSSSSVDVDSSVIVVDENGRKIDRVYYGKRTGQGIQHAGDDRTGSNKYGKEDNEEIYLMLDKLNPKVQELYIVANIFSGASDFSKIKGSYMRLIDSDKGKEELARYELSDFKGMGGVVLGKVYKRDGWKFKAIGEGVRSSNLESIERSILR